MYYPDCRRTGESCRRKFNSLCNTKPRTGEPRQHPNVERAKAIRNCINSRTGSNNAEDDAFVEVFFDDNNIDNIEFDEEGAIDYNPPAAETPIFVHQQSSALVDAS